MAHVPKVSFSSLLHIVPFLFIFLIFSYVPVILLGKSSGTNIDGSLLYAVTMLFVLASLPMAYTYRKTLSLRPSMLLLASFASFATLSVAWSDNTFRAAATAGFIWLMTALVASVFIFTYRANNNAKVASNTYKAVTAATLLMGGFALWQIFAEAASFGQTFTLLPQAYQSALFGFARPTAFALEPQFFGNLLLVPLLYFMWCVVRGIRMQSSLLLFAVTLTVLILTVSRGAIVAGFVGLLLLLVLEKVRLKKLAIISIIVAVSLACAVVIIASAVAINNRSTLTPQQSLAKTLNQLSLGVIDIPVEDSRATSSSNVKTKTSEQSETENGYVVGSTTSRLTNNQHALALWTRDVPTILFGVGVGDFGSELHRIDADQPLGSIVNNYYLETLAELGIVGFGLFAAFVLSIAYGLLRRKQRLLLGLIVAFLVQLNFFSGNANIIHVWVILGISMGMIAAKNGSVRFHHS